MIDEILTEIDRLTLLYLINAVVFDAEWKTVYNKESVREGTFTDINGIAIKTEFMYSDEYIYIDDGLATGFIKPYSGDSYSFAALLPNEDILIETYLETLTGDKFLGTLGNAERVSVIFTSMPKFEDDF